jgi:Protein of unknown function (DUF3108)
MKKFVLALLCVGVAALGRPAALDRIIVPGETLDYNLTWLGLTGGKLRTTIALVPNDPQRIRITFSARSSSSFAFIYKVRDQIESIVNRGDFSTLRYEKHLREGGKTKDDSTTIDERRKIATRRRPGRDTEEISVTKPVFDPLSLVYHLRDLDLTPGREHRFTVFADGKIYTLVANVTTRQTLETPAGTFQTVTVEPKMQGGGIFRDEDASLTLWFTDDARHIPVRIRSEVKVGTITANLRRISAGITTIEPPR